MARGAYVLVSMDHPSHPYKEDPWNQPSSSYLEKEKMLQLTPRQVSLQTHLGPGSNGPDQGSGDRGRKGKREGGEMKGLWMSQPLISQDRGNGEVVMMEQLLQVTQVSPLPADGDSSPIHGPLFPIETHGLLSP